MRLLSRVLAVVLLLTALGYVAPAEAATRPSAPRSVKATPGNKVVKVTWAAPASTGGARITGYAVQRRNTTSKPWVNVKYTSASARAWTETGLVNGARFYYRVLARNAVGWGTASPQVSAVPRTVPSAVPFFEADTYDRALGAYWPAPADGGAPIDHYRVELSTDGATWTVARKSTTAAPRATPLKFTGLTPGSRYWLRIRAHNAAGYGPATGIGPYRSYTTPGAVTGLGATPGDGQVQLTWTAPVADSASGLPAATEYAVEVSADAGATWSPDASGPGTTRLVTGLANGTTYSFRVRARSGFAGIGPGPAAEITPGAPVGPPTAPQALTLGWDEAAASLRLAWTAPANDGGSPLDHYEVEWWNDTTVPPRPSTTYAADATGALVSGFPLDHRIRLRACNAALCGAWSDPVGPITGPVTDLAVSQATVGTTRTVTVDWDPPANDLATSYDIRRSTDGTTFETLATVSTTEYADPATAPSTGYTYQVVPHGGGAGEPRTATITTAADQGLHLAPATVPVTEGASAQVQVSLDVVPATDTVVALASSDPAVMVPSMSTVTVPAGSSSVLASVGGVADDDLADGSAVLTASLGTLTATATVLVDDDDTQSITLSATSVAVDVGATVSTITVRLAFRPAAPVTITVAAPADRLSVQPAPVVLGPGDWNVPQALSITGLKKGGATITLTSPGLTTRTISVDVNP